MIVPNDFPSSKRASTEREVRHPQEEVDEHKAKDRAKKAFDCFEDLLRHVLANRNFKKLLLATTENGHSDIDKQGELVVVEDAVCLLAELDIANEKKMNSQL